MAGFSPAFAHGALHEQIEKADQQIKRDPRNAELYLKRAELFRQHEEWDEAVADYAKALKLKPGLDIVYFDRGNMYWEQGKTSKARADLDVFLKKYPKHVKALRVRGRLLFHTGKAALAARDFEAAIAQLNPAEPEDYIECAQAYAIAPGAGAARAAACLDRGIAKIGPIVTLELPAIEYDVKLRRFDSALARVDVLAKQIPREEIWLARRADILDAAGRPAEARAAREKAIAAIEALPETLRTRGVTAELEGKLRVALARTSGK